MKRSVFVIVLVLGIISCNQSSKQPTGKPSVFQDTLAVAYETKGQNNWQLVRATYAFDTVWAFGSKNISEGKYKIDTAKWKFYVLIDTLRDEKTHKPIYDSTLKQWKAKWDWIELTDQQKATITVKPLSKLNK